MTEEKNKIVEEIKKYAPPILIFLGGIAFERYMLPAVEGKFKNRFDERFYEQTLKAVADFRKFVKDKPDYSILRTPLDVFENYLSERKYREQNK